MLSNTCWNGLSLAGGSKLKLSVGFLGKDLCEIDLAARSSFASAPSPSLYVWVVVPYGTYPSGILNYFLSTSASLSRFTSTFFFTSF